MSRIFLSHSWRNNAEACALRDWLADHGWDDVFLDLDPRRGLVAGQRWQEALKAAADRCEAVLFLLSPAWAKSRWCQAEFLLAKSLGKHVFGVLVEAVDLSELPGEMAGEFQIARLVGPCSGATTPVERTASHDRPRLPRPVGIHHDGSRRRMVSARLSIGGTSVAPIDGVMDHALSHEDDVLARILARKAILPFGQRISSTRPALWSRRPPRQICDVARDQIRQ